MATVDLGSSSDETSSLTAGSQTNTYDEMQTASLSSLAAADTSSNSSNTALLTDTQKQPLTTSSAKKEEEDAKYSKYGGRCKQATLFFILLLANVLGPLSTEAQVPALEDIAIDLHTSSQWVQLSITLYMLFFGASQLVFGSLSDVYGRRKTLLAGLIVYTLTNIGCALAPNVILLNIFRCFQAMGSGTCMVVPNAIATDVFDYTDRTRVLAILNSIRVIIIVASPIYGGIVATFLGWRYIFWIIGGLSCALVVVTFIVLPETQDLTQGAQVRSPRDYYNTLKLLVKHRVFVGLMLISGSVYAGVFIMFNEFSFVMTEHFNHTTFEVTLLFGFVILGLMIGSILSAVVTCFHPKTLIGYSIFQILACGATLIIPFILFQDVTSEYWSLVPLCLYVGSDGLMMAPLMSTAVEPFRQQAGTANALSLFWRFFCGAVIALIISISSNEHLYVLHFGIAGMAVLSAVIFLTVLYPAKFPVTGEEESNNLNVKNIENSKGVRVDEDPSETDALIPVKGSDNIMEGSGVSVEVFS